MSTLIEAVYEDGVLKPLAATALKERQRYRVMLQEVAAETPEPKDLELDPASAALIASRTTVLPDGRELINLENIMAHHFPAWIDVGAVLDEAMAEVRRERQAHFEAELDEFFPLDEAESGAATR